MIKLNIIPDKIKKEIKLNFLYNVAKKTLYILIIFFSIFGIALMISEYILLSTLAKEINGTSLNFKNSANSIQNKVNEINNKLVLLENIQKDFTRWSLLYNFISKETPDKLVFSRIEINKKVPSIIFKGTSDTRDNLLVFKKLLEDSLIFENIDFPIQNLLQKENISCYFVI
jgi:hypothetical protein